LRFGFFFSVNNSLVVCTSSSRSRLLEDRGFWPCSFRWVWIQAEPCPAALRTEWRF